MSNHEASAQALGYLYQTQWPLIDLIHRAVAEPDAAVTLEALDDVEWDRDGTPVELLQLKHHVRSAGIGDKNRDLWKTIGVWMDGWDIGDAAGPRLTLVTTARASEGSAAWSLKPECHDADKAEQLLLAAAEASTDDGTEAVRSAFRSLTPDRRSIFVGRMRVRDASVPISGLDEELRKALSFAVPVGSENTFVALVWKWWNNVAIAMLKRERRFVDGMELRTVIDDLRDQFSAGNLPTTVEHDVSDDVVNEYLDEVFVHQLRFIDVPSRILQSAIQDYYRAYTQSARWIEDNLVGLAEVEKFEWELRDEWSRDFAWMEQSLPDGADEATKVEAGRSLLRKLLDVTSIRIREKYDEPFFYRGKLHQLADENEIGWHPDFVDRVEELLIGRSA